MFTKLIEWIKKLRPEDPRRMRQFRQQLQSLKWDKGTVLESLSKLFDAVDDLAEAEVRYYYRRRGTRAWLSSLFRSAAWAFASIGLLLPLLSATEVYLLRAWGQFGYAFLALAACFLAGNALFGGTTGHVRFVSTQLELEKLITSSRIGWCAYLARASSTAITDDEIDQGFAQIQAYSENLYKATLSETGRWGDDLIAELLKYQQTIAEQKKDEHGTKQG